MQGGAKGYDVPVGQHRTREALNGQSDLVVVDWGEVALRHGPAMDGEQIDFVSGEDFEEAIKLIGVLKANSCFDRKRHAHGGAQFAQKTVDLGGISEQASTRLLAANAGGGTTEVEVDPCHGILLKFPCGGHEARSVLADHLGDHGLAGGILHDGSQDLPIQTGVGMNPEVFREVKIRVPIAMHDPHEG
jgi:hypothetical protein